MVGYVAAAAALKFFSLNRLTRKLYRSWGNVVGARIRLEQGLPDVYVGRARNLISQIRKHDAVKPGDHLLEIGTGWLHWEATVLRLLYDVRVSMCDIWDNRQFPAFHLYFSEFAKVFAGEIPMSASERNRAAALLARLIEAKSFDEVYAILGNDYVLDPTGVLRGLPDSHYSVLFSSSVLEHIKRESIPEFLQGCYRVLKPGGYAIHLIDLGDHLTIYDRTMPYNKNYLRYSEKTWKMLFENEVQYFNRVQRSTWLEQFAAVGFELVEERPEQIALNGQPIARSYQHFEPHDLQCLTLHVIHKKPQ